MIRVNFDDVEKRVSISLRCKLDEKSEREFNLNRSQDEEIGATFEKLYSNYEKHASYKLNKSAKKKKTHPEEEKHEEKSELDEIESIIHPPVRLYDTENKLVDMVTTNKNAWIENYTLKLNDQSFRVCLNLPSIHKLALPKFIMSGGVPVVAKVECNSNDNEDAIMRNSIFTWYATDTCFSEADKKPTDKKKSHKAFDLTHVNWVHLDEGRAKRACIIGKEFADRVIRVACVPSDGKREGVAVEAVAAHPVVAGPDLERLPMSDRHKLTQNRLSADLLRVMSYNILASCYSDTVEAKEELFTHCPLEYLDFKYRRILLLHEIKNYNSDIIFLQECEKEFFHDDLMGALIQEYDGRIKLKGEGHEGEAILFRSDRFRFIQSHDIALTEELMTNPLFEKLWANICKSEEFKDFITKRATVLQVIQVESIENPGHQLLLANSHFFFHPTADFIRLLQAIVSIKYLENLKKKIKSGDVNNEIKKLGVIFGGDLNSDCMSKAFKYIFSQVIPREDISESDKQYMTNCGDELHHSMDLSIYADFPYTNYVTQFQETIDHLFYEASSLELVKVIPLPAHDKVIELIALPNKYVPSDHLAIIFEFKLKLD